MILWNATRKERNRKERCTLSVLCARRKAASTLAMSPIYGHFVAMTDEQVLAIQQFVEHYLSSKAGRFLDIGVPAHFAALVEAARSTVTTVREEALWIVVATCWLGPRRAGIPPASVREQLQELLQGYASDEPARLARVMEIVIAYGCGKWRQVFAGSGGWEHRWQGAMRGLVRAMEPAVAQANRWLAAHVVNFPNEHEGSRRGASSGDTTDWSDAWLLGIRFVCPEKALRLQDDEVLTLECTTRGIELLAPEQGYQFFVPPGAKALWTVQEYTGAIELPHGQSLPLPAHTTLLFIARDDDVILKTTTEGRERQMRLRVGDSATLTGPATLSLRECTCGTTHCIERHRLAGWDPRQKVQKADAEENQTKIEGSLTLWDCLAAAVKGPQATMKTGAFVQGLYFPLLAQEGLHS